MAKTRKEKEASLEAVKDKLERAKTVVFVSFDGLKVKEVEVLRKQFREEKIDYLVIKKNLLRKAFGGSKLEGTELDSWRGGVGMIFGYEDEILPAKLSYKFSKDHKALKLIGGIFNDKFISREEAVNLAQLPGREELLSKTLWLINYPLTGLVGALAGNLRNLINVLNALKNKTA